MTPLLIKSPALVELVAANVSCKVYVTLVPSAEDSLTSKVVEEYPSVGLLASKVYDTTRELPPLLRSDFTSNLKLEEVISTYWKFNLYIIFLKRVRVGAQHIKVVE